MWISYSPDLFHWGNSKSVACTRPERWDAHKNGSRTVPIKTKGGWLLLYCGTSEKCNGWVYRCGSPLHDLKDPSKVLQLFSKLLRIEGYASFGAYIFC